MLRQVKTSQRLPRMLAFKVTGTGTAAINVGSFDATLTDNGVGSFTLTFAKPFARAPMAVATAMTADVYCEISAESATAITILCKAPATGAATDAVFNCMVMGFDAADEY